MSDTVRPLPPEFSHPALQGLLEQGKDRGYVTAGDVRTVVERAGIPPARLKAVLRGLSDEGVSVMVEAEGSATTRNKAVAAATAAKRASTTKSVAAPAKKSAKATEKKATAKKAPAKKAAAKTEASDEAKEGSE